MEPIGKYPFLDCYCMLGGIWADNTYLHILSDEYIWDILALEITDRVTTLGDPVGQTPHPINL